MLADLTLVNCFNENAMSHYKRNEIMLQSAKRNLKDFAFFGITEFQTDSQYLFESIFENLKFNTAFQLSNVTIAANNSSILKESQIEIIRHNNYLDIELYKYATHLFHRRLKLLRKQ